MKKMRSLLAVVVALAGAACGGNTGTGTGKVSVLLKDGPGELQAAVVTISEVDLVGAGGVKVLTKESKTTNLLTLANDTATLAEGVEVETGTYTQLRFVISGGYVQAMDGTIYATSSDYAGLPAGAVVAGQLRMPSMMQSGLKIDLPGGAVEVSSDGTPTTILVDFKVEQSFGHEAGNSGAWVMHPVCQASRFELAGNAAASFVLDTGVTLPTGVSGLAARLTLAGDTTSTGVAEPLVFDTTTHTASVTFKYLVPGSYEVNLEARDSTGNVVPATFTVAAPAVLPIPVAVTSGHTTTVAPITVKSITTP